MKKALVILLCVMFASCGGAEEKSTVSVMSFNIRLGVANDGENSWEYRKQAVARMIETIAPDVIGLQEAMSMQNDYLAEQLPKYAHVGVGRDDGEQQGEFMLIMYNTERYELADSGNMWLSETPHEVSRGWDGACNRMITWVELREKSTGKAFRLFNTHLDHRGEEARREGVKLLVKTIDNTAGKEAIFVTGDFNAHASDELMQPMFAKFASALDEAPDGDIKGTFNGFGSTPNNIVIDYIFSQNAKAISCRTVTEDFGVPFVSDHYPLIAKFEF